MKKKLYLILSILTIIILLATAAICNLGGTQGDEETQAQATEGSDQGKVSKKDSSGAVKSSDSAHESNTENSASGGSDKKDESKSDDNKSAGENKPPVISGIYLDGLDPIDYFFFTGDTYTVRAEAIDPENGSLTFSWSGDGTIAGSDINPMTWTAPATEGVYNITVEATDDKGATSDFTSDIYVNVKSSAGQQEPNNPPVLGEIQVCGDGTIAPVAGDDFWDDIYYNLYIQAMDPDGDNLSYSWTVTVGKISNPNSNPARWDVPKIEWQGNEYESVTITVTVDDGKGGTVTTSRTIDLYVV
jgi:hypothetical protein